MSGARLNREKDGYFDMLEVEFVCPACGEVIEAYEVPVNEVITEEVDCGACDKTLTIRTSVTIDVYAKVKG